MMILESVPATEKRLQLSDAFIFSCHRDLACFNTCCRNKHLPLTPFDICNLRKTLGLHSDDFLSRYTLYQVDPGSGFPVVTLKMMDDQNSGCPFVTEQGCGVYEDRPTACRLYPLGRAVGKNETGDWSGFYFMLDTPKCMGVEEKHLMRLEVWEKTQGLRPYVKMNDLMLEILFHPKRDLSQALTEKQVQKIMIACYNLDVFREFIINTSFLDIFQVEPETRQEVKEDDISLLKLGISYLKKTLF